MGAQLFSGNVRFAYCDANGALLKGYLPIVNTIKLALNVPNPDLKTQISKENGNYGQALDEIVIPKPTEAEVAVDDVADPRVLAWSVNGSTSAFSQAGGAITNEVITAHLGQWVQLANRQVSAVVVKDSTGTTTFVNNVDYVVDPVSGMLFFPETGGTITEAESIKINYTAAALTGTTIGVGGTPFQYFRVDGDMTSLHDNSSWHVVLPCFKAYAAGSLDLLGSNLIEAALKGKPLALPGQKPAYITAITSP